MENRKVVAALEIADHEIRMIVAEWHVLKFNVLKVERVECSGINKVDIVNKQAVINSINKAVNNASKLIDMDIKRVVLLLPSYRFNRISKRVVVNTANGLVSYNDVFQAIKTCHNFEISDERVIVNAIPFRYGINGVLTKHFPLNEKTNSISIDMELLCCDKQMVFDYISLVEECKLEVLDICTNSYALALEAGLLDKASSSYVLQMCLERQNTTLSLLANGKLISSTIVDTGYGEIIGLLADELKLPLPIATRLVLYNLHINRSDLSDSPIYCWNVDSNSYSISERELSIRTTPLFERWAKKLKDISSDILACDNVSVVISGEGAEILGLDSYFSKIFEKETLAYIPDTLGIRTSSLAPLFGSLLAYNDQKDCIKNYRYSIDQEIKNEYEENDIYDTLSSRFKKIFTKKKGE